MQFINSIIEFFVSSAHAEAAAGVAAPASTATQQQGGGFSLMLMMAVFVFFMYFVVWRPQNKRAKEQRDLLNAVTKGDEVVTAGGILGKITKVADHYVVLALSDTVEITIQKSSIVSALPKGTLKSI